METLIKLTNGINVPSEIWIGLKKTGKGTWSWSVGEKTRSAGYSNWAASPASSHHCGGMGGDGKWFGGLCNTIRPFVCHGGRDEWQWSDQSNSSFRQWAPGQPDSDSCTLIRISSKNWWDRSCAVKYPLYCYEDVKIKHVKIVRVEMKSDPSLDLNDEAVSNAILQELKLKFQGLDLQWRVQDGKIFQEKEKKKINEEEAIVK
ncbi:hypothetical protein KUCAC02_027706 [Chaenocephalus aceratus]|uniref:Uncharacterized protein n=1 Tax=Chaenocephalus aceratus TaxID=36190 RepID=A0ACB9W5B1_CHAAC|nr:hypothetical protein KUCAC02_027706 [Chaenocephalus aceratus]